ncbi:multidrug resistance regulator 1 [[Candida] railenensis]|uniref:Multidrug resistance regulator 1 n=1 Tax=[Candida] railenensis TaxID=45579 RepID=A0A9P0QWS4_9ASCO|nr:multidrug resistance regulator 1 [[Candida] railenensis]
MDFLPIKKRNRPSLVCEPCKRRKIKCDKGRPCESCTKNNIPHKCTYSPTTRKANVSSKVAKSDDGATPRGRGITAPDAAANNSGSIPSATHSNPNFYTPVDSVSSKEQMVLVSIGELNGLKQRLHNLEQDLHKGLSQTKNELDPKISFTPVDQDNSDDFFQTFYKEVDIRVDRNSRTTVLNQYVLNPSIRDGSFDSTDHIWRYLPSIRGPLSPDSVHSKSPSSAKDSAGDITPTSTHESYSKDGDVGSAAYMIGVNPYSSNDDDINFYENYNSVFLNEPSRRTNYGPLSWATISRKDKLLSLLKKFMQEQQQVGKDKQKDTTADENENENENRASFEKKELESDGVVDLMPYGRESDSLPDKDRTSHAKFSSYSPRDQTNFRPSPSSSAVSSVDRSSSRKWPSLDCKPQLKVSDTTIVSGIHDGSLDNELKLISKIESILPKQRVLWLLIHRFFSFIYTFLPYIDERDFRGEMNRILGPEDYKDRKILHLNINKRLDFAYLGMLLIFLRFSYLSIESKHSKFRVEPSLSQNCEYLLANPIDTSVIDVAKSCINQFQIMRKFNFTVFQATFYLRMYHIFAPEEGDGADGGDSLVFNGLLVQMAYSIGIHREPGNFNDDTLKDERVNSLGRKIWYHILVQDFVNSYTYGTPMATNEIFYDAKLPKIIPGVNENVMDTELEKSTVQYYGNCDALLRGPMRNLLRLALNVKKKVKMSELTKQLNFLEIGTFNAFGKLGDYITFLEDKDIGFRSSKAQRLIIALSLKAFYLSFFYHFLLYYEEKKHSTLMFFYLKKILTIAICENIPFLYPIIYGTYDFFEDGVDLFINPKFLHMLHRTSEINIAAIVRANFVLFELKTHPNHELNLKVDKEYKHYFERLLVLIEHMEKCARLCIAALTELSSKYYYAWGAARSQSFIYKIVTSEEFFVQSASKYDCYTTKLTMNQVEELIQLYGPPLELAEKIIREHCQDIDRVSNVFTKKATGETRETQNNINYQTATTREQSGDRTTVIPPGISAQNKSFNFNKNWENTPRNAYSPVPETPSSFLPSYSNVIASEFEDLHFSNSAEVDSAWLQMLTSKNDNIHRLDNIMGNDITKNTAASLGNSFGATPSDSKIKNDGTFDYSQAESKLNGEDSLIGDVWSRDQSEPINVKSLFSDSKSNFSFEDSTHFNFFSDLPLDMIFRENS